MNTPRSLVAGLFVVSALWLIACEDKQPAPTPAPPSGGAGARTPAANTPAAHDDHDHGDTDDHEHADGDDHDHDHGDHDHAHEASVPMGTATIGAHQVTVARGGEVAPGKELHLNITVAGGAKPAAVRVWVGTQDARGSIKGKADPEGEGYHGDAEIPDPMPAGSKLWIELEDDSGAKSVGSLDLK